MLRVMSTTIETVKDTSAGWWQRSRAFLTDVRNEMKRVSWPSRREVYATTVVVIITSVFFGVYLWLVDMGLNRVVGWIFRTLGA